MDCFTFVNWWGSSCTGFFEKFFQSYFRRGGGGKGENFFAPNFWPTKIFLNFEGYEARLLLFGKFGSHTTKNPFFDQSPPQIFALYPISGWG